MTNSQSSRAERLAAERASSGRPARPSDGGIDPRAGMRSTTASIHSLHSFDRKSDQVNRPSIGRRIFRTITRFVVTVLIGVGGTLAWQSYGDTAREMVAARAPTLAWLVAPTRSPAVAASPNPAQPALVASNLDAMRRSLDLLTARQEQVAENLTAFTCCRGGRPAEDVVHASISCHGPDLPASGSGSAAKSHATQGAVVCCAVRSSENPLSAAG